MAKTTRSITVPPTSSSSSLPAKQFLEDFSLCTWVSSVYLIETLVVLT